MNDNHSRHELKYRPRWLASLWTDPGLASFLAGHYDPESLTTQPKFSDIKSLRLFLDEYPETSADLLVYTGEKVKIMQENIVAVPWFLL